MSGMSYSYHPLGMHLHGVGLQAKIDQRPLRKRRIGFHVATAQAQVGELAMRYGFVGVRTTRRARRSLQPETELCRNTLGNIEKMHASLSVRIGPCHLTARLNLQSAIWQLKVECQQGSWSFPLRGPPIHCSSGKDRQNSVQLARVG